MIYFIQAGKNGPIKIGYTENDIASRMAQLQTGCPYELKLLWKIHGNQEKEVEIHNDFEHERICGEWFRPSRMLLEYIEDDACNEWMFEFGADTVDITETKNTLQISSDRWWFEEKKNKPKFDLTIDARMEVSLDLGSIIEKYNIEVHRFGIGIKAVDPNSLFRPVFILLEGEKVVTVEKG